MPNLGQMYPSRFLSSEDFSEGQQVTLVITGLKEELLGRPGEQEKKWLLGFRGTQKQLVLNKTNAKTIGKLYGEDTDGWIGAAVTLFTTPVDAFGETKLAIRVLPQRPKNAPKPATAKQPEPVTPWDDEPDDEDVPF